MGRRENELDELGYTVLTEFMSDAWLGELRAGVERLFAEEGGRAGSEFRQEVGTRRLANLVDKGTVFEQAVVSPDILVLVRHVLGEDFKLSSLNVRSANPHSGWTQPLHVDMGLLPDHNGYLVANTVWLLDDFTADNGSLRVVPGTHRSGRLPQDAVADLHAPLPGEVLVTAPAGTVVVMNAHLWHGGTANRTGNHRRAMHGFYCRGDVPQQQYQKRLLRPETQARLNPEVRRILALDDPRNDALSATGSGQSGFLR